jgi:hypothetical protein
MLESWDIRHWLVVAILILVNIVIFGCLALVLMEKIVLPI